MLDTLIRFSLRHRFVIVAISIVVAVYGGYAMTQLPVDVLPSLDRPTVTIFAERDGLAPEEIESLVTYPIERGINGAPGIVNLRSVSSLGLGIVSVEFDWGTDISRDRQLVTERLASVGLPTGTKTTLGPTTSLLGEIVWAGVYSPDQTVSPMQLRSIADWTVRQRLRSIPWVADVLVMGGEPKQYQVLVKPERLTAYGLTIDQVTDALKNSNENRGGGFLVEGTKESPIRIIARTTFIDELRKIVITNILDPKTGVMRTISVGDIADVALAPDPNKRGDAIIGGQSGVLLRIIRQPNVNTLELTGRIEAAFMDMQKTMPQDVQLTPNVFKQKWFIESGLTNVEDALRDSAIMVAIILILFLMSVRTTVITLTAIPLSILITFIVFRWLGVGINVMTLGGIVVAIGELVDDGIVDVENVFRRLRENALLPSENPTKKSSLRVVLDASSEIRNSIVYATILVMIVFVPLLLLPGVDGQLLAPVATAYIAALGSSLLISLTVVPVLCSWLLPILAERRAKLFKHMEIKTLPLGHEPDDSWLVRRIKATALIPIYISLRYPRMIFMIALATVIITVTLYMTAGKEWLPPFNEPTYTTMMFAPVGSSLAYTRSIVEEVSAKIRAVPWVTGFAATIGRADADAHASGVSSAEFAIRIDGVRPHADIEKDIQTIYDQYTGRVVFSLGQPITHRMQMLVSGVRAPIVLRLYGPDLDTLQSQGQRILAAMKATPWVVNAQTEQELKMPQIGIYPDRDAMLLYGINSGALGDRLETGLMGMSVGEIQDKNERYPLVVKYDPLWRGDTNTLGDTLVPTVMGRPITLSQIATVQRTTGQNTISHDNAERRLVITGYVLHGYDVVSVVEGIRSYVDQLHIPEGYAVSYEGDYQSQQQASRQLLVMAILVLLGVATILYWQFGSWVIIGQILLGVVVAALGGMIAVRLTGNVVSTAHLVGFISLIGIVSRNGIMLISHYIHLYREESVPWSRELIIRGSIERIVPVMMTALTASLGLIPLLIGGDATGKELLSPIATVIFGGIVLSTLVELFIRPWLFYWYGEGALKTIISREHGCIEF